MNKKHNYKFYLLLFSIFFFGLSVSAQTQRQLYLQTGEDGYLGTWLVSGPFKITQKNKTIEAPPIPADIIKKLESSEPFIWNEQTNPWQIKVANSSYINLKKLVSNNKNQSAFLMNQLFSQKNQQIYLSLGTDDGSTVWLNGEVVYHNPEGQFARPDSSYIPLNLKKGNNNLIIGVYQYSGRWGAYIRFLDNNFAPLKNAKIFLPVSNQDTTIANLNKLLIDSLSYEMQNNITSTGIDFNFKISRPSGGVIHNSKINGTISFWKNSNKINENICEFVSPESFCNLTPADLNRASYNLKVFFENNEQFATPFFYNPIWIIALNHIKEKIDSINPDAFEQDISSTIQYYYNEIENLIKNGEEEVQYITTELQEEEKRVSEVFDGTDPFSKEKGLKRRAYKSILDDTLQHYSIYIPKTYNVKAKRLYPLVVGLHGFNGETHNTIQVMVGHDREEKESAIEAHRNPDPILDVDVFMLAPFGYGNADYKLMGEEDILEVINQIMKRYPIDPRRIYITGASMGGTGTAFLGLRYPSLFAAMAPLCGYHDNFLFQAVAPYVRNLQDWEQFLLESRSNYTWAENGMYSPLYIIHGTKDRPQNSKGLVKEYEDLGYDVVFQTPNAAHNVWKDGYAKLKIIEWLRQKRLAEKPRKIIFKTANLRYNKSYWAKIIQQTNPGNWSNISVELTGRDKIFVQLDNINVFALDLTNAPLSQYNGITVKLSNGQSFDFSPPWKEYYFAKFNSKQYSWSETMPQELDEEKRPGMSGPIDDIYHTPIKIIYGTQQPELIYAYKRIADSLGLYSSKVNMHYPVVAEDNVTEDDLTNYSLILVGTPQSNAIIKRYLQKSPFKILQTGIQSGGDFYSGSCIGLSYIYPNPLNKDRYILIHTGNCPMAPLWSVNLPRLLPDWIIYDEKSIQWRGGLIFADLPVIAGGFFNNHWQIDY